MADIRQTPISQLPALTEAVSSSSPVVVVQGGVTYRTTVGDLISAAATSPSASIQTITSASTITPVATNDLVAVSALAVNATIANPTGAVAAGQGFVITVKDDGTARTLTWGSNYVGMDCAPVATTTAGKLVDIPVRYSSILSKWLVYKPSVQA